MDLPEPNQIRPTAENVAFAYAIARAQVGMPVPGECVLCAGKPVSHDPIPDDDCAVCGEPISTNCQQTHHHDAWADCWAYMDIRNLYCGCYAHKDCQKSGNGCRQHPIHG